MHSNLEKQLSNENIEIIYSNLNNDVAGCYYSIDGLEIIVINEPKILNTKQRKRQKYHTYCFQL